MHVPIISRESARIGPVQNIWPGR